MSKNINNIENIDEYIEKQIENKFKDLLTTLPDSVPKGYYNKPIYEYTIIELYKNTLQTSIDILNDLTNYYNDKQAYKDKTYSQVIFDIFLNDNRKVYVGILLIFLSFVIYFIDGASI
jgi:hypothetical protein